MNWDVVMFIVGFGFSYSLIPTVLVALRGRSVALPWSTLMTTACWWSLVIMKVTFNKRKEVL